MSKEKIEKCFLCGRTAEVRKMTHAGRDYFSVHCSNPKCTTHGKQLESASAAISSWNSPYQEGPWIDGLCGLPV